MKNQRNHEGAARAPRKLVLRREAIAELTPAELTRAVGGATGSVGPFCGTTLGTGETVP